LKLVVARVDATSHGADDALVARASAQVARQHIADLGVCFKRVFLERIGDRGQHSGRTKSALQSVVFAKRLLQRAESIQTTEALNGSDFSAVRTHSQYQTGANTVAVHEHCAGPAGTMFTSDMGAGQAEFLAQEIGQQ